MDWLRNYCLAKKGVEETLPFGPDVLVFKVMGKVFLLCPLTTDILQFNAKCHPDEADEMRAAYTAVAPGFHMNKNHWNTITVDGSIPVQLLKEWIDRSYELVVKGLPQKTKNLLAKL